MPPSVMLITKNAVFAHFLAPSMSTKGEKSQYLMW